MNFEHYFDRSSHLILGYIYTGTAFDLVQLEMRKGTGGEMPQAFFVMQMKEAFITKVANSATDDGNALQKVELVLKWVSIDYKSQGQPWAPKPGALSPPLNFDWDIPGGKASPSTGA